jgi:hypothetical protein
VGTALHASTKDTAAMAGASSNLHVAIAEHLGSLQADDVADAKALDQAKTALRSESGAMRIALQLQFT